METKPGTDGGNPLNYHVKPSSINGSITIATSKSHTMRAILFGAMARGKSTILGYLDAPDTLHMINACRLLGAKIDIHPGFLEIDGVGGKIADVEGEIQAGNSGIILRFLTAIAALSANNIVVTGDHSLQNQRPMGVMLEALKQLKVYAVSNRGNGYAPLTIRGPFKGGKVKLSGEDSQPISALLIACSMAEGSTEIYVTNPGEKPWIDLTLKWLDRFGMRYTNENYVKYTVEGHSQFKAFEYTVPGDWSSAAFPIAAALVTNSSLTVENLDINDPQGDKGVVEVLKEMGALIEIDNGSKSLTVKAGGDLKGITIDVNPFIDAITILAVLACFAKGETRIINASVARNKECDRLHCISVELKKMGAVITESEDQLVIQGGSLQGGILKSYGDHRMAMSLAVAALGAKGDSTIEDVECVAKTFPNFIGEFQAIGAKMEMQDK